MHRLTYSKIISRTILLFFIAANLLNAGNPVRSKNGMVVSANSLATEIGVEILKKGGNAIDAAVAVGFALAVTYPNAGNLGGGGFFVIHLKDGTNTTLDFREKAPLAAFEEMFLDEQGNYNPELSQTGWKSAGVPGTVAGLCYALEKYGTMKLEQVIQPAIKLAEYGFVLDFSTAASINSENKEFNKYESSKKIFTKNGEKLIEGELFVQPDLTNTLKIIKEKGSDAFYKGEIAKRIVEESNKNGGIYSLQDFHNYKVVERPPVVGDYKGYKIVSMGPPSSGGLCLIQALNVLENISFEKNMWNSSYYIHMMVETLKRVYANRAEHIGDSDFVSVPIDFLISKEYAKSIFESITDTSISSFNISAGSPAKKESEETTHYSVADKFGNAVSVTYTLNSGYGNKIVVDGLGFLLNNEMDDFSSKPGVPNQYGLLGSFANSIQPGKRMLSSMTPTIVLKENEPVMIIGTPGGSTIITQVIQTIMNVLEFKMNIYDAIASPRFHHQWLPDEIYYEDLCISTDVMENLLRRGHKFGSTRRLGLMEGITIDQTKKIFYGTSDPRGYGKAMGF